MNIKPFAVEEWMNAFETGARYNIAETCVDSISMDELFDLSGEDKEAFLSSFCARRLTYGDIMGSEMLKEGKEPYARETHGGSGAKDHFGLGLHIADILAEKHGGTLSLANSIRGGAFASVSFSYRKS